MRRFRFAHYLKTSMWFVPLLFVLAGVGLSLVTTTVDDGHLVPTVVTGDANAALQILYLIAFSMLTLTGLVLSLVVVVVQLAMGVFSPRIVRQILQDRPSQAAIGLFGGTFAHAILAMRGVRTGPDGESVPGLAVVVALVLVLVCIATLIWYLNHVGQSLRVAGLVGSVANDTMATLDHTHPGRGAGEDPGPDHIMTTRAGVVFRVEHDRLVALARRADCRLDLLWAVGDFVPTGAALVHVRGAPARLSSPAVLACIAIGPERTLNQDVSYGIRMIVDIALRALSSGPFEDPTTAVQAIDRIHDIMRQLSFRELHSGRYDDAAGELRLVAPTMRWDGYVRVAFDELRQAGAGSPQVSRRLKAALADLVRIAPPDRRAALEHQLTLLDDLTAVAAHSEADQTAAQVADPSGIGSSADLLTSSTSEVAAQSVERG